MEQGTISHQGQPSTPTSNITGELTLPKLIFIIEKTSLAELNMKLAILIIALIGAALALPQEAPEEMSASMRQDKPNPAEARAASPQKPDIVSDRQSAKGKLK